MHKTDSVSCSTSISIRSPAMVNPGRETRQNEGVRKFAEDGRWTVAQITSLTKGYLFLLVEDRAQEKRWSGPRGEGEPPGRRLRRARTSPHRLSRRDVHEAVQVTNRCTRRPHDLLLAKG